MPRTKIPGLTLGKPFFRVSVEGEKDDEYWQTELSTRDKHKYTNIETRLAPI